MENLLFGSERWRTLDPGAAPAELVIDVERMLASIAAGPTKDALRREILQKRMSETDAGAPRRLALPFAGGWTWVITFERPGIYHAPRRAGRTRRPLSLGFDDPHFPLPILRRQEAQRLAAALARRDPTLARFGALLLAPAVWLTLDDDLKDMRGFLREAFARAAILDEAATDTAIQSWGRCEVRWRQDRRLGSVNDGSYSHRNPENSAWAPADFAAFARFLAQAG